ncbi:MAG: hypothetical protein B6I26_00550 [Desulfobacteraceae bacterium 4572_130]|nr:MAG: hypothetical protein B6I26_00550 [Desulfobacteraceae bacterium 4572_130]
MTSRAKPIFLYITAIIFPVIIHIYINCFLWYDTNILIPKNFLEHFYYYLNFIWFIPILWVLMNFFGLLFGAPKDENIQDFAGWTWDPTGSLLIISYVSRGDNQIALKRAIAATQQELDSAEVKYAIEIVTDQEVIRKNRISETNGKIYYYIIPDNYETKTKVKYKARALQYLLEMRTQRFKENSKLHINDVWVLHLDEESIITSQLIMGIRNFILKYNMNNTKGALGQGEILYNAYNYGKNIFITAIDALRTGDDLGRFRLQYKIFNKPLIGMHGSFVLLPAKIEQEIGWDSGGKSCLTEDAYFALLAAEKKVKFDWVNGFIKEQSPFTVMDIIRQRARWYTGLIRVATDSKLKLANRFILMIYVFAWTFAWFGAPLFLFDCIVMKLIYDIRFFPFWATILTAILVGLIGSLYVVGAYRNVYHLNAPFRKKAYIVFMTYVLFLFQLPMLVESSSVIYALYKQIFNPIVKFHIVNKN